MKQQRLRGVFVCFGLLFGLSVRAVPGPLSDSDQKISLESLQTDRNGKRFTAEMWSTLLTTIQSSFNRAIQNHEARLADLKGKYNTLQANHNELLGKHNQLLGNYNILVNGHNELVKKHNTLQTNHNELLGKHNTLKQDLQNKYDELKNKLPKRGQCGSTLRSCNAGVRSNEVHAGCGGTSTWICKGENAGGNDHCKFQENCKVNGECPSALDDGEQCVKGKKKKKRPCGGGKKNCRYCEGEYGGQDSELCGRDTNGKQCTRRYNDDTRKREETCIKENDGGLGDV